MTINEKIKNAIEKYKDEYDINDITKENGDLFYAWRDISWKLDENGIAVQFTPVQDEGDSFVICSYYVSELDTSFILEWSTRCKFENESEIINEISRLETMGQELSKKITCKNKLT